MTKSFNSPDLEEIQTLFALALKEDRVAQDITSRAVFSETDTISTQIVAREEMVVAGVEVLGILLKTLSLAPPAGGVGKVLGEENDLHVKWLVEDGDMISAGTTIATISGSTIGMLSYERTILNLLQRLCGVATLTRQYVDAVAGTGATILDTRKTIPGWRVLDKYAGALWWWAEPSYASGRCDNDQGQPYCCLRRD